MMCWYTVSGAATVSLEHARSVFPGETVELDIIYEPAGVVDSIAGFQFTLSYDSAQVSVVTVFPGQLLVNREWTYFSYSDSIIDPLLAAEGLHLLRMEGSGLSADGPIVSGGTLATLVLEVSDTLSSDCLLSPIQFTWTACRDNIFSLPGLRRYISDDVYYVDTVLLADPITADTTFPTSLGSPSDCLIYPGLTVQRAIDFYPGYISFFCDPSNGQGSDFNDNGIAFELDDFAIFKRGLLEGIRAYDKPEVAALVGDVNGDSRSLGLADWVSFGRLLVSSGMVSQTSESVENTAVITLDTLSGDLSVSYPEPLSAVHLTILGTSDVTAVHPDVSVTSYFDGRLTRVLVTADWLTYLQEPVSGFTSGVIVNLSGSTFLLGAALSDTGGDGTVPVSIAGGHDIGRSDLNGNNIPYDAHDWSLYRDFYRTATPVVDLSDSVYQTAVDVNGDGVAPSLGDFLHLYRVTRAETFPIMGDRTYPDGANGYLSQQVLDRNLLLGGDSAGAVTMRFNDSLDVSVNIDPLRYQVFKESPGDSTRIAVLPRLTSGDDYLPQLPILFADYTGVASLVDFSIGSLKTRSQLGATAPPIRATLVNDTVANLVRAEYDNPMNTLSCYFDSKVGCEVLVDSFTYQEMHRNGLTSFNVLPTHPGMDVQFGSEPLVRYSGQGRAFRGQVSDAITRSYVWADVELVAGTPGDLDYDGVYNIVDLQLMVGLLYFGHDRPLGVHAGDMNRDGRESIIDLALMVERLFGN